MVTIRKSDMRREYPHYLQPPNPPLDELFPLTTAALFEHPQLTTATKFFIFLTLLSGRNLKLFCLDTILEAIERAEPHPSFVPTLGFIEDMVTLALRPDYAAMRQMHTKASKLAADKTLSQESSRILLSSIRAMRIVNTLPSHLTIDEVFTFLVGLAPFFNYNYNWHLQQMEEFCKRSH